MPPVEHNQSFLARRRKLIVTLLILLAVVLLASFAMRKDDSVPVRTATVLRGTIRSTISTNGKVEPVENFEAHAPVSTTVKRVLVKEGDHVRKGQLMIELDDADARSQAARARAQLSGARADIHAVQRGGTQEEVLTLDAQIAKARTERDAAQRNLATLQALQAKGAAAAGEVTAAQNAARHAEADLQLLEQKQKQRYSQPEVARVEAHGSEAQAALGAAEEVLQKSNIRAAFDGVVYVLPVKQGMFVQAGDLIVQEADLSRLLVRTFVDEPDIGRLAPGDKMEVTWDAVPGRIWKCAVGSVPSAVKLRGTRNVGEVTCVVENSDAKLLPNINVGATIVTAEDQQVLIAPRESVRLEDGKPYVFEVVGKQARKRTVQTSISNLTGVEISGGLTDNAVVAMPMGIKPLRDGSTVKIVQ